MRRSVGFAAVKRRRHMLAGKGIIAILTGMARWLHSAGYGENNLQDWGLALSPPKKPRGHGGYAFLGEATPFGADKAVPSWVLKAARRYADRVGSDSVDTYIWLKGKHFTYRVYFAGQGGQYMYVYRK